MSYILMELRNEKKVFFNTIFVNFLMKKSYSRILGVLLKSPFDNFFSKSTPNYCKIFHFFYFLTFNMKLFCDPFRVNSIFDCLLNYKIHLINSSIFHHCHL